MKSNKLKSPNLYIINKVKKINSAVYTPNPIKKIKSGINSESKPSISWEGTDTDLLELITALLRTGKINNQTKNLTRKDAIKYFENIFNLTIKDSESKLKRATDRKTEQAPFSGKLKAIIYQLLRRKG